MNDKFYFSNLNKIGRQFILDAVDISSLKPYSYDLVLSCNSLEHIANPLKALKSWINVLSFNGSLIVIVPNNVLNFDHQRLPTTFDHILIDYESNVDESDLTHLEEILDLHDLRLDPLAGSFANFKIRCLNNHKNRAMHHHVFDKFLLYQIFDYLDLNIVDFQETTNDIFIVGTKQSK